MIGALHKIRNIAKAMQAESSVHDPRQKEIAEIIEVCDCTLSHFTDDGK